MNTKKLQNRNQKKYFVRRTNQFKHFSCDQIFVSNLIIIFKNSQSGLAAGAYRFINKNLFVRPKPPKWPEDLVDPADMFNKPEFSIYVMIFIFRFKVYDFVLITKFLLHKICFKFLFKTKQRKDKDGVPLMPNNIGLEKECRRQFKEMSKKWNAHEKKRKRYAHDFQEWDKRRWEKKIFFF